MSRSSSSLCKYRRKWYYVNVIRSRRVRTLYTPLCRDADLVKVTKQCRASQLLCFSFTETVRVFMCRRNLGELLVSVYNQVINISFTQKYLNKHYLQTRETNELCNTLFAENTCDIITARKIIGSKPIKLQEVCQDFTLTGKVVLCC